MQGRGESTLERRERREKEKEGRDIGCEERKEREEERDATTEKGGKTKASTSGTIKNTRQTFPL